jgi:hypothetical protein
MSAPQKPSPAFRRLMTDLEQGVVLLPLLRAYLTRGKFGSINVPFFEHDLDRGPDGWFHPSTHPLWPEMMLYHYQTSPEAMVSEVREWMGSLSITMGSAMHGFITACLTDMGLLLTRQEMIDEHWTVGVQGEPLVSDPTARSRGAMDGILKLAHSSLPNRQHFEFKTSNNIKLRSIENQDLDKFKSVWPEYWAQAQEYLRMSRLRTTVLLMMGLGYPWEMREFHIPADERMHYATVSKYRRVISAVERRDPKDLMLCCAAGSTTSKACPARRVCVNGSKR